VIYVTDEFQGSTSRDGRQLGIFPGFDRHYFHRDPKTRKFYVPYTNRLINPFDVFSGKINWFENNKTIPEDCGIIGAGVSFDGVFTLRAGIAGEVGTFSIQGEDYVFASKSIALGKEASAGANMFLIIGPKHLTANDFAGFSVSGTRNWGVTGWSAGWSPAGYYVAKFGLGAGFGGSITMGGTVIAPAPDLFAGTEFQGSPYGPVP